MVALEGVEVLLRERLVFEDVRGNIFGVGGVEEVGAEEAWFDEEGAEAEGGDFDVERFHGAWWGVSFRFEAEIGSDSVMYLIELIWSHSMLRELASLPRLLLIR